MILVEVFLPCKCDGWISTSTSPASRVPPFIALLWTLCDNGKGHKQRRTQRSPSQCFTCGRAVRLLLQR